MPQRVRAAPVVALLLQLGQLHSNTAFAPTELHLLRRQLPQSRDALRHRLAVAIPTSGNQQEASNMLSKLALLEQVRQSFFI